MGKYRVSKEKLALLRKNLAERERKLREFQRLQERQALTKKIILFAALAPLVLAVAYYLY